jgi:hypothetical protein
LKVHCSAVHENAQKFKCFKCQRILPFKQTFIANKQTRTELLNKNKAFIHIPLTLTAK